MTCSCRRDEQGGGSGASFVWAVYFFGRRAGVPLRGPRSTPEWRLAAAGCVRACVLGCRVRERGFGGTDNGQWTVSSDIQERETARSGTGTGIGDVGPEHDIAQVPEQGPGRQPCVCVLDRNHRRGHSKYATEVGKRKGDRRCPDLPTGEVLPGADSLRSALDVSLPGGLEEMAGCNRRRVFEGDNSQPEF